MDLSYVILIVVAVAIVYLFVKFVLNPIIKAILAILLVLIALYIAQNVFKIDFNQVFGSLSPKLQEWGINLNWILNPLNYLAEKSKPLFDAALNYIVNNIKTK
jgi:hypothetical protein